jgi:hypothetical protein
MLMSVTRSEVTYRIRVLDGGMILAGFLLTVTKAAANYCL